MTGYLDLQQDCIYHCNVWPTDNSISPMLTHLQSTSINFMQYRILSPHLVYDWIRAPHEETSSKKRQKRKSQHGEVHEIVLYPQKQLENVSIGKTNNDVDLTSMKYSREK